MSKVGALEDLLNNRHSCRAFLQTPIATEKIQQILEIAQRCPSWCNTQPWQLHLISGSPLEELRKAYVQRVKESAGKPDLEFPLAYRGEYLARRRESGFSLYSSLDIAKDDKNRMQEQLLENFRFFGAPHLAVVTTEEELGTYGAIDCGCYIGMFLLAAQSLGVAAIPQAAIATHSDFIRDFLRIPPNRLVVAGIAFGLEDAQHPANRFRTTRAQIENVVTWIQ